MGPDHSTTTNSSCSTFRGDSQGSTSNVGTKRRRSSKGTPRTERFNFTLASGNPLKRKKTIELGKPKDYHTNLNSEGKPITRGDEGRLMDPPVELIDDLYWIRSDDRTDPDMLDLVNQLNQSYDNAFQSGTGLDRITNELFEDMKSRVAEDEEEYPCRFYDTAYEDFTRMVEGKGHPIYYRRNVYTRDVTTLLDVNEFVKSIDNPDVCDVTSVSTSFDCKYLSYCVDLTGDEKYALHIHDLETGQKIDHDIPIIIYGDYLWAPDSSGVFYYGFDDAERLHQVMFYSFETRESTLIYEESDILFQVGFQISKDLNYILIDTSSMDTTEYYFCHVDDGITDPNNYTLVRKRETGVMYTPRIITYQMREIGIDRRTGLRSSQSPPTLVIRANVDNAVNFKIVVASIDSPGEWSELVPHDPERFIESIDTIYNYVLIDYREAGYSRAGFIRFESDNENLEIVPIDINTDTDSQTSEIPSTVQFSDSHNLVYESLNTVYVRHMSFLNPTRLIRVNLPRTNRRVSRLRMEVVWSKAVPNYDPSLYGSRIIQVPSSDGKELIPMSILYRRDLFDPENPTPKPFYLYGYGSYGINNDTPFLSRYFSLVDRGFIFGIAHVRGSSSKGYRWYLDGKMHKKQNTFSDFIDCARWLVENKYTVPQKLSAEGRSAGGLLMGAITTQAPELFNTVVMGVPFLDVLVTMCDSTIPLTTDEWIEWGNPNYLEDYEVMASYSPMNNLKSTEYPNTYITCGLNDPRVQYWEPVKFHLRLLENAQDQNTHLIRVDMDKGHFTNTDRYAKLREFAKQYAFVVWNTANAFE